ncbi:virulence factor [Amorphus coralli]|uniref:virulence factor n=1 Tax=Amorphus coralli TaxID=340680 RepID=UPI000380F0CF|nr:virulence factor [Amorphus coralli]
MADRVVVFWRDIPAQVIVKSGRRQAKRLLPDRFAVAIDRCAMASEATGEDPYLADWRRGEPEPCGDDLDAEADAASDLLNAAYPIERLTALIETRGYDHG